MNAENGVAGHLTRCVLLASLILTGACASETAAEDANAVSVSADSDVTAPTTTASTTTTAPTTTTPATTTSTTTIPAPEPIPIVPPDGMALVWSDEFDDDQIDRSNWTYDIGGWGWGNGESQYYTNRSENAWLANGLLHIQARQEKYDGSYYTSARLKTQGLREFEYGRIEARIRVPRGDGTWPAFWMLGAEFDSESDDLAQQWPNVGEIDIMEHVGREPDLVMGTVHGPGYSGAAGLTQWLRQDFDIADEFHVYAVEWDASGIRWFFDGEAYHELTPEELGDGEWVFDHEFFLILNLAMGGSLPGPIGLDVEFPLTMYVDFVRVYQSVSGEAEPASGEGATESS